MNDQQRAAFEAWLSVKPCGAAHDFAWEAWQAAIASPEVQALREDAELYRFLREQKDGDGPAAAVRCIDGPYFNRAIYGERLDATIRAAMEKQK